ncbi:MAG: hypothetical protein U0R52_13040 [Solirubrobacterales bacterium]
MFVIALGTIGLGAAFGAFSKEANTVTIAYGTAADATASCGGGKHVNFGGFRTDTDGDPLYGGPVAWPGAMGPLGNRTDKWSVEGAANPNFHDKGGRVTSIAYCRAGKAPKVVRNKGIVLPSVKNGGEVRKVSATCPKGRTVIGGGWSAQAANPLAQGALAIMDLERTTSRKWQVGVTNLTGGQQGVTAIALCGVGSPPTEKDANVLVHENHDATATARCPRGKQVVFGGFRGQANELTGINAFIFDFYLAGDDKIKVYGAHTLVGPAIRDVSHLTAIAYCR